ncbi:MAG TPA: response regulator [Candidatus Omnitrophota bacterium]|nr:response regulator [Candidatus Omnitrophota bacterium]
MSKKILLVDDEKEIVQLLDKKLSQEGFEVIKLSSGKEAVDKTKKYLPDLVLMDIMMPDIDGAEAVKLLQKDTLTRNIPVLFLSGILAPGSSSDTPQGITVGGIHYPALGKPFTAQQLLNKISELLIK